LGDGLSKLQVVVDAGQQPKQLTQTTTTKQILSIGGALFSRVLRMKGFTCAGRVSRVEQLVEDEDLRDLRIMIGAIG
jgi:hypothetical protein